MAFEQNLQNFTGISSGDLSASQYALVVNNGSGQIALAGAAANADGVLQDKPTAAGQGCAYAVAGITKVIASAAISRGASIGCAASGKARTAVTDDFIIGRALEAATDPDQIISMLIVRGGKL